MVEPDLKEDGQPFISDPDQEAYLLQPKAPVIPVTPCCSPIDPIANPPRRTGLAYNWQKELVKAKTVAKTPTIGMFDSGVGGLTVYMELKRRCPNVNVIYFADMARQP